MPRHKQYRTNAEKHRAYRKRKLAKRLADFAMSVVTNSAVSHAAICSTCGWTYRSVDALAPRDALADHLKTCKGIRRDHK